MAKTYNFNQELNIYDYAIVDKNIINKKTEKRECIKIAIYKHKWIYHESRVNLTTVLNIIFKGIMNYHLLIISRPWKKVKLFWKFNS